VANSIDRVKQSIRDRLQELDAERDQLLKALAALGGESGKPSGRRRGRPRGSGRVGKRAAGRRAPRGQRREQVIAVLQGGELGPTAIAQQIGDVNPTQISGLLRQLASEGVVTKSESGKWRLGAGGATSPAPVGGDSPVADSPAPAEPVAS
jgi:DNA-binding transcriptional ArsR family regulator